MSKPLSIAALLSVSLLISTARLTARLTARFTASALPLQNDSNAASAIAPAEGSDLLGTQAPEFEGLTWMNAENPLTLQKLRGKVVLIRFWLMNCPFCSGSAPALNQLWATYENNGLVVIGIHHPKSTSSKDLTLVKDYSEKLKFKFPIAVDNQWHTINSLWLQNKRRSFTSATLLIDKRGKIRWVHSGGLLELEHNASHSTQFDLLEKEIQLLLAEH